MNDLLRPGGDLAIPPSLANAPEETRHGLGESLPKGGRIGVEVYELTGPGRDTG
jgi:hypothetical protein